MTTRLSGVGVVHKVHTVHTLPMTNTISTKTFFSNLRRTHRAAFGTKAVRTVSEGNEQWGSYLIAESSDRILVRVSSQWQIDGKTYFQLSAENGAYFTSREIAKKLKTMSESIRAAAL